MNGTGASLSPSVLQRIARNKQAALERRNQKRQAVDTGSRTADQIEREDAPVKSVNHVSGTTPAQPLCSIPNPQPSNKRVLPSYVVSNDKRQALRVGSMNFPSLVFSKEIVYVQRPEDTGSAVQKLLDNSTQCGGGGGGGAASQVVLGFDIEWFVTFEAGVAPRGVATVQLCSENCCVVFQTSSFTKLPDGKLPPDDLVNLLEDPTVLKVGVGAGRDAIKVKTDLGVGMQGVVNLEDIAAGKAVDRSGGMSLASLCASLLGRQLAKPPHLRLSNWETVPLTWAQLDYAALDAYAGLRCHQALQRVPNKPRPDPRPQTPAQNTLQSEPGSEACPHDPLLKNQGGSLLPSCGEDDDDEVLVPRREPLGRLAPSKLACWDMWALQGWSVAQVAEARSIKPGTAVGYVCDAVEAGYEYPWGRLGVPRDVEALVRAAAARAATAAAAASAKAEEKAGTTEEPPRTATETIPEGLGMAAEGEERSAIPASSQATQVMVRANTAQERSQVAVRCAPQMRAVREQLGESNTATPYWAVRAVLLHMDRTGCFGEMRQKPDA